MRLPQLPPFLADVRARQRRSRISLKPARQARQGKAEAFMVAAVDGAGLGEKKFSCLESFPNAEADLGRRRGWLVWLLSLRQ